ncbi:MAG TPA: RluA family pseudouridine synthase [Burkholderiaceae bacterium]|nr:RluA family pseudouridine synthase [Burkholderiaceae bacterium]
MPDTDIAKESSSSPNRRQFFVPNEITGERLDRVLASLMPEHSRSRLQAWIDAGHVRVNEQKVLRRQKVSAGDCITVFPPPEPEDYAFTPQPVCFEVIAQSPQWLVVNKRAGLVVHPGAGNWQGTLLNGLLHRFPQLSQVERAGIVHRLDKDTSGLMVVALTATMRDCMVTQLKNRRVLREYRCLVKGHLGGAGKIAEPLGRDPRVPVRMTTQQPIAPRDALTYYKSLRMGYLQEEAVTELLCRLETGRTHQIRVHLKHLGHPIVGDTLYGGRVHLGASRQLLHAQVLGFIDTQGLPWRFEVSPPDDYQNIAKAVQWLS